MGKSGSAAVRQTDASVLEVDDLRVRFDGREGTIFALNGVSFELRRGEVLSILGESGSGKSVTLRALLRLLPPGKSTVSGQALLHGKDLLRLDRKGLADVRGSRIAMIFQEPLSTLDPVYSVGHQITETIMFHDRVSRAEARRRALQLLDMVQIPSPERRLAAYPHELSGGMAQRVMIALALSCRPDVLLADEPTTALDVTVQIQILLLLRRLQEELGMSILFVTHDVGVACEIADRVAIMYAGRFVETGPIGDVLRQRAHPYTEKLLASTVGGITPGQRLDAIRGAPPVLTQIPKGCSFASRCEYQFDLCTSGDPGKTEIGREHIVRCFLRGEGNRAGMEE